jgi:hypothetical protein
VLALLLACGASTPWMMSRAAAQQPKQDPKREQGTRQLWDEEFLESRPQPARPAAPKRRPPRAPAPVAACRLFVGVTV